MKDLMEVPSTQSDNLNEILDSLVTNPEICFKSQQRNETDLSNNEKHEIATQLFNNCKLNFLLRFGRYLKSQDLKYFEQFTNDSMDSSEITLVLRDLQRARSNTEIKNRRFEALQQLVEKGDYFSEMEMMKRNPLLYDQLVGQFMSEDEKRDRDNYCNLEGGGMTLVKVLMESIERKNAERRCEEEHNLEDDMKEESDSDEIRSRSASPRPSGCMWGEFEDEKPVRRRRPSRSKHISYSERKLLKEEFISTMYKSFLTGNDEDFDYKTVDSNEEYVNIEAINCDEEEKYFDSEEAADAEQNDGDVSSEDELDIFMHSLKQSPAVAQLATEMTKL